MKKKVLLISVLKPIDDTRMYEKLGYTLVQNGYEVHIVGHPSESKNPPCVENIKFYPIYKLKRISIKRFFVPLTAFFYFIKIKPDIICVETHELLRVAVFYKIFFGCRLIYDVRENYYYNIAKTKIFPILIRNIIAISVRVKEWSSSFFINRFILAEKVYESQMSFFGNNFVIAENKFNLDFYKNYFPEVLNAKPKNQNTITLLFSGTIDDQNGIFECIELIKKLQTIDKKYILKIIGCCTIQTVYQQVSDAIKGFEFIELIAGNNMIPHPRIIEEIVNSDFGLISYKRDKYFDERIPTKLYEYLALKLPIICIDNPYWEKLINRYNAGILIDFERIDLNTLISKMNHVFYTGIDTTEVSWKGEEEKILNSFA